MTITELETKIDSIKDTLENTLTDIDSIITELESSDLTGNEYFGVILDDIQTLKDDLGAALESDGYIDKDFRYIRKDIAKYRLGD